MQNLYLVRIVLLLEQIMAVLVFTGFSFGVCLFNFILKLRTKNELYLICIFKT
jgi:hypothetical protein